MCQINNRNIGDKKITYHLYFLVPLIQIIHNN